MTRISFTESKALYDAGERSFHVYPRYPCKKNPGCRGCDRCENGADLVHFEQRDTGAVVLRCGYCNGSVCGGLYDVGIADKKPYRQANRLFGTGDRWDIFKRDGSRCFICGAGPEQDALEADHIIPASLGGPTEILNGITLCSECNNGKLAERYTPFVIDALRRTHYHQYCMDHGKSPSPWQLVAYMGATLKAWGLGK